ncbi:MAG: hypothetical protein LBR16_06400 [Treponema sp.]|jgi:hypothetical protein|nr:hypothetical protein [Treponema sp.]
MKRLLSMVTLFFYMIAVLPAQTTTTTPPKLNLPQWVKDLRRAEAVAIGAFPLGIFFSTIGVDTWRYYDHGQDIKYAPWPLKPADAIERSSDEQKASIYIAIGISVAVAVTDYFIVLAKRRSRERAAAALPEGTPILIRKKPGAEAEAAAEEGAEGGEGAEAAAEAPAAPSEAPLQAAEPPAAGSAP